MSSNESRPSKVETIKNIEEILKALEKAENNLDAYLKEIDLVRIGVEGRDPVTRIDFVKSIKRLLETKEPSSSTLNPLLTRRNLLSILSGAISVPLATTVSMGIRAETSRNSGESVADAAKRNETKILLGSALDGAGVGIASFILGKIVEMYAYNKNLKNEKERLEKLLGIVEESSELFKFIQANGESPLLLFELAREIILLDNELSEISTRTKATAYVSEYNLG